MFLIDANKLELLEQFLTQKGWLAATEKIESTSIPGEGNMNYVLRIKTTERTFILKQARPYVEKYPFIPAPAERSQIEAAFYTTVQQHSYLKNETALLLGSDSFNNLLMLEDLGTSSDFTDLYSQKSLTEREAFCLTFFLNELHHIQIDVQDPLLENKKMKKLNHEYIFVHPFMDENGLDLNTVTDGLKEASLLYKNDDGLKSKAEILGEIYLENGRHLLHGDYYPASWLRTDFGVKIIDPEFCFYGPVEFDLSVMIAHCYLSNQQPDIIDLIISNYNKPDHFNKQLFNQFTGIEILRRLLGLAQLPLNIDITAKKILLKKGYDLIMSN